MRLSQHIFISGAVSLGIFGFTKSALAGAISFLAGFLMDVDHVFDYWKQHPKRIDIKHFFSTCEEYKLSKVYLWMHSVELLIVVGIITYYTRSAIMLGCLVGFTQICFLTRYTTKFIH